MEVQTQENVSYRSADAAEVLDWTLPQAASPRKSIAVILDWFSGHLAEEVEQGVRRKGRVLLFHGGGCTPCAQINDAHFRASLARMLLIQFENDWASEKRRDLLLQGKNGTPELDGEDIVAMVQEVWGGIDHRFLSKKECAQTGPMVPSDGPGSSKDLFPDSRQVAEAIARDKDRQREPGFVDAAIREEAKAFVNEGWQVKLREWGQQAIGELVEEHAGLGEALEDGQEAFGVDPAENDEGEGPGARGRR